MSEATKKPQTDMPPPLLVESSEAARMLGVKPDCWRKRIELGLAPMPHSRMGNRSYYRRVDIMYRYRKAEWPDGMKFKNQRPSAAQMDSPRYQIDP